MDAPYIKQTAAKVVDELMKALMAQAEHIKAEVGLQWVCGYEPEGAGVRAVLKYGRVALEVWWRQVYTNVMEDVALECTEYNGPVLLRSENRVAFYEPRKLAQRKYFPTLNMAREMRWIDKSKPEQLMSNDDVVEKVMEQFLSLVDRVDRGKIPAINY